MATSTPREEDAAEGGGSVEPNAVSESAAGAGFFDFGQFHALYFPGAMRELLTPTTEPGG